MKKIIFIACFILPALTGFAQFSLSGDIFVRPEFRYGYGRMPLPEEKPAAFVNQRTRLILDFKKDQITTKVSFQDARTWGQQPLRVQVPSIDLHEAWINIAFSEGFSVKAGRQELKYDNFRFLAHNDWLPWGNKHDALLLRWQTTKGELHFASAFNQSGISLFGTEYSLNNYKTLNYLWYNAKLGQKINMSILGMVDGYQDAENQTVNFRGTWHAFITANFSKLTFRINPAYQNGKTRTGQDINAWYLMTDAQLTFNPNFNSRIGFEYFSGNDALNPDPKSRVFDVPYTAGHALLGFMDYFTTNIPGQTKGAGLFSPYWNNSMRLGPKTQLNADLHVFFLGNNYQHQGETIKRYLGTEADFTLNYRFNDITQIAAGYSVLFGTESMEVIRGGSKDEFAHWAYIVLRIRPKFL